MYDVSSQTDLHISVTELELVHHLRNWNGVNTITCSCIGWCVVDLCLVLSTFFFCLGCVEIVEIESGNRDVSSF